MPFSSVAWGSSFSCSPLLFVLLKEKGRCVVSHSSLQKAFSCASEKHRANIQFFRVSGSKLLWSSKILVLGGLAGGILPQHRAAESYFPMLGHYLCKWVSSYLLYKLPSFLTAAVLSKDVNALSSILQRLEVWTQNSWLFMKSLHVTSPASCLPMT